MALLLHLLTAASVLVHATIGCCAHMSHGMTAGCCGPQARIVEAADGCSRAGHSHQTPPADSIASEPSHSSEPHMPHECCHADCKWPIPEVRNSDCSLMLVIVGTLSPDRCVCCVSIPVEHRDGFFLLPYASAHGLPVRAHLAKSVMLL